MKLSETCKYCSLGSNLTRVPKFSKNQTRVFFLRFKFSSGSLFPSTTQSTCNFSNNDKCKLVQFVYSCRFPDENSYFFTVCYETHEISSFRVLRKNYWEESKAWVLLLSLFFEGGGGGGGRKRQSKETIRRHRQRSLRVTNHTCLCNVSRQRDHNCARSTRQKEKKEKERERERKKETKEWFTLAITR